MASIRKRGNYYHIRFTYTDHDLGKDLDRSFSLKTRSKKEAIELKAILEEDFRDGKFYPFSEDFDLLEYLGMRRVGSKQVQGYTLRLTTEQFLEERKHVKKATINTYRRHFKMMMDKWGSTMPVHFLTENDIRDFCFKPTVKPVTQKSYLRHLKVFFGWLHEKELIENDITKKIKPPRIGDNIHKQIINDSQFFDVINAHKKHQAEFRKKKLIKTKAQMQEWFYPMMYVYYFAGLRAQEGVDLRWDFIDFEKKQLFVTTSNYTTTKSGKGRTIQMQKELIEVLKAWHEKFNKPKFGFVFPSPTSKGVDLPMDPGYVSKQFKAFARKAGLSEEIKLNSLRHSCASNLANSGMKIHFLQKFMGHSSITTTMIYVHINSSETASEFDRLDL